MSASCFPDLAAALARMAEHEAIEAQRFHEASERIIPPFGRDHAAKARASAHRERAKAVASAHHWLTRMAPWEPEITEMVETGRMPPPRQRGLIGRLIERLRRSDVSAR